MRNFRVRSSFVGAWLAVGCVEALPPPVVVQHDPSAVKRMEAARTEHDELEATLALVVKPRREQCEFSNGDCRILVSDERDAIIKKEDLSDCNALPDPVGRLGCVASALRARGKEGELASFYEYESSCTKALLACTSELDARAAANAVEARADARRRELELSPKGALASSLPDAARARVEYLRATLPPAASASCDLSDSITECVSALSSRKDELSSMFRDESYAAPDALSLHQSIEAAEAKCRDPEIECLTHALEPYGLFPEARKWVERNMAELGQRSELASRVSPRTRASCTVSASTEHQDRIVQAYVAYTREPVLYFRERLDKAFLSLHDSEIACLSHALGGAVHTASVQAGGAPAR
ncbi:MAG TPA: hypothetical protein VHE30_07975 [Polyangiaceae bacterium]|nr:hypothetical protein [Polyangiaceae bacterium]